MIPLVDEREECIDPATAAAYACRTSCCGLQEDEEEVILREMKEREDGYGRCAFGLALVR